MERSRAGLTIRSEPLARDRRSPVARRLLPATFLVPLLVAAGFSIATAAIGVSGLQQAERTYRHLVRFDSGDSTTVDVAAPGRQWVWVRHDDYASESRTSLTVKHEGMNTTAHALPGDVTYQDTASAVTAVWAFDADQPGDYTLTADSTEHSSQFLVGAGNPQVQRRPAVRLIKIGTMGAVFALALLLAIVLRRRRQAKQFAVATTRLALRPTSSSAGSKKALFIGPSTPRGRIPESASTTGQASSAKSFRHLKFLGD